jgi:hypothetical protein
LIFPPFFQPSSADCDYMPEQIVHVVEDRARSASVLLSPSSIERLVQGAVQYTMRAAVLPVDPEADARMDKLLALNRRGEARRPLKRR